MSEYAHFHPSFGSRPDRRLTEPPPDLAATLRRRIEAVPGLFAAIEEGAAGVHRGAVLRNVTLVAPHLLIRHRFACHCGFVTSWFTDPVLLLVAKWMHQAGPANAGAVFDACGLVGPWPADYGDGCEST